MAHSHQEVVGDVILAAVHAPQEYFGVRRDIHRQDHDDERFCAAYPGCTNALW